eukprot:gene12578-biopygen2214
MTPISIDFLRGNPSRKKLSRGICLPWVAIEVALDLDNAGRILVDVTILLQQHSQEPGGPENQSVHQSVPCHFGQSARLLDVPSAADPGGLGCAVWRTWRTRVLSLADLADSGAQAGGLGGL